MKGLGVGLAVAVVTHGPDAPYVLRRRGGESATSDAKGPENVAECRFDGPAAKHDPELRHGDPGSGDCA